MTGQRAILIGQPATLERLERQLDLIARRPETIGWVLTTPDQIPEGARLLGSDEHLDDVVRQHQPDLALICLPAVETERIQRIRTDLRRLKVPDRFMPTIEDQIAGVGPRMQLEIDLDSLLHRPRRNPDIATTRSLLAGKRVLITGAGGSIGSELARIVSEHQPASLVLMDRSENALFEIDRQIARRQPDLDRRAILHDIVQTRRTNAWFDELQPQIVFHAAAHKHVPMMEDHPSAAVDNNVFGTVAVCDAADRAGVERFVMISTDKAVKPSSVMGATKRLAETYVQAMNRKSKTLFSMVRFGNVLGSSGSVLETWSKQIADGGPVTVTDSAMTRYFMTIPEAAALVIESAALVDDDTQTEVFLLDMGEPVRILELAESFIRAHGLQPVLPVESTPRSAAGSMRVVFTGIRPGEKLHEQLAFDGEQMRETDHPDINAWLISPAEPTFVDRMLELLQPDRRPQSPARLAALVHELADNGDDDEGPPFPEGQIQTKPVTCDQSRRSRS